MQRVRNQPSDRSEVYPDIFVCTCHQLPQPWCALPWSHKQTGFGQRCWQPCSLLCTAPCSTGVKSRGQSRFFHWQRLLEDQQSEEVFCHICWQMSWRQGLWLLGCLNVIRSVPLSGLCRRTAKLFSCFRLEIIPQHTRLFFLVIFHFLSHFQLVHTLDLKLLVYSLGVELSRNGLLPAGVCVGRTLLNSQEMFGTQVLPATPQHQVIWDGMRGTDQNWQTWKLWLQLKHRVKSESFQKKKSSGMWVLHLTLTWGRGELQPSLQQILLSQCWPSRGLFLTEQNPCFTVSTGRKIQALEFDSVCRVTYSPMCTG